MLTLVAQVDVQPVAASSLMLRLAGVQSVQQRPFRGFQQVLVITCVDTWWKIGGDLHCWLHNTPKSWITSAQQHFAQHAIPMSADDEDGIHGDVAPQGDSKHPSSKPDGVAAAQPASPTHVDAITTHQPPTQSPAAPPTPPVPDNPTNDDTTPDEDPNHDTMNNNNDASKQDAPVDASPAAPALTYAQRVKANLQQQAGGTSTNGGGGAGGVGSSGSVGMARHGGQRTSASMHSAASSERGGGHEGHDGRRGEHRGVGWRMSVGMVGVLWVCMVSMCPHPQVSKNHIVVMSAVDLWYAISPAPSLMQTSTPCLGAMAKSQTPTYAVPMMDVPMHLWCFQMKRHGMLHYTIHL